MSSFSRMQSISLFLFLYSIPRILLPYTFKRFTPAHSSKLSSNITSFEKPSWYTRRLTYMPLPCKIPFWLLSHHVMNPLVCLSFPCSGRSAPLERDSLWSTCSSSHSGIFVSILFIQKMAGTGLANFSLAPLCQVLWGWQKNYNILPLISEWLKSSWDIYICLFLKTFLPI